MVKGSIGSLFVIYFILHIQTSIANYLPLARTSIYYQLDKSFIHAYFGLSNRSDLGIDLNSQYTWIFAPLDPNNITNFPNSKIINESIEYDYGTYNFTGRELEDKCYIEENKDKQLICHFYVITNKIQYYIGVPGVLAMPFKFLDERHSVIHNLKKLHYINHLSFSILNDYYKGRMLFGGIPSDDIVNKTHSSCDVIGKENRWDCYISQVIIANYSSNTIIKFDTNMKTNYTTFDLIKEATYVSSAFYDCLIEGFYAEAIKKFDCNVLSGGDTRYLLCADSDSNKMGEIIFRIGRYDYKIQLKTFWRCDEEQCVFSLYENKKSNEWIIGMNILNAFDLHFDYEDHKVNFYSLDLITKNVVDDKSTVRKMSHYNDKVLFIIMTIILIINVLGIIILGFFKLLTQGLHN